MQFLNSMSAMLDSRTVFVDFKRNYWLTLLQLAIIARHVTSHVWARNSLGLSRDVRVPWAS